MIATLPPHRHAEGEPLCDISAAARERNGVSKPEPHVVILGAGFGGLSAARTLAHAPVRVTLIDRRNHHLFQPLLYQVATAGLSPAQIVAPIRTVLRRQANTTVLLADVLGIDTKKREVILEGQRILYDYLIAATGGRHFYFGHDEWEPFAPGLKSLEDATKIRRRILLAFERAEIECDPRERSRLLTFAIVGAGPTGVEMAGAIAEIARHALASDFRNIDPKAAHILLIEAGPRVLPSFPDSLSANAHKTLEHLGVDVSTGQSVTSCGSNGITFNGERIDAGVVIWAAGVSASPAAKWLGAEADRAGRIMVDAQLRVPGLDRVFAVGDTAHARGKDGKPLPGLAPVAKQQGQYVARLINKHARGSLDQQPFAYRSFGNLATIGRKAAVADFGVIRLKGLIAWLLWSVAHIYFLIGFRNRLAVAIDWLLAYLTYERGARLITGEEQPVADASHMIHRKAS